MTLPEHLPLTLEQLHRPCDPVQFGFQTTADLECLSEMIGQMRAMDAVKFGAGMRHEGYNIFLLGPSGLGKRNLVRQYLEKKAEIERQPADWCYLFNFNEAHKPLAVRMPSGRGAELRQHMEQLVDYLRTAIPILFDSDEYRAKAEAVQESFNQRQEQAFKALGESAKEQQIVLLRTPQGFAFAPTRKQEVIQPEEFEKLKAAEKKKIGEDIAELQERLSKILRDIPQWWNERTERLKQLNRETTQSTLKNVMDELRVRFSGLERIQQYLDSVQQDMVEHVDDFRKQEENNPITGLPVSKRESLRRYQVNVLVSHSKSSGAPIVSEDNPSFTNLIGRVEHKVELGALVTDFTLIKPGSLHRANGGYLLLDARKLLMQPMAWEGLKRALQSREIHIESLGQMYSAVSTVSLEPEPIPLNAKIVLFGERQLYYLLQQYDQDFSELFKVAADFEERIDRNADNQLLYARLIATFCTKDKLLPFDRSAVARVIDQSARWVGDSEKLSTHMRSVADLLQEADYWARQAGQTVVDQSQVQLAIDTQIHRRDRIKGQLHEAILRGTVMIDTQGSVTGQINALSVLQLGDFAFAQPSRITATSRLGAGEMINIEREVKLSGAIHSKGVLIMSAFLAQRYAKNQPLALSASLVFEQSYGGIDGDSASLAELCALLSSLAETPIRQSLAVTGSVNQLGQVQAIGAVNEKIEGFFDICQARGLSGEHGVLIPAANVKHLMLRQDVREAVAAGKFQIYALDTVDQALALLTGLPSGTKNAKGSYPKGSINQRVASRVTQLKALRKSSSDSATKEKPSTHQPE